MDDKVQGSVIFMACGTSKHYLRHRFVEI